MTIILSQEAKGEDEQLSISRNPSVTQLQHRGRSKLLEDISLVLLLDVGINAIRNENCRLPKTLMLFHENLLPGAEDLIASFSRVAGKFAIILSLPGLLMWGGGGGGTEIFLLNYSLLHYSIKR